MAHLMYMCWCDCIDWLACQRKEFALSPQILGHVPFRSVQFSALTDLFIWGTRGMVQQRSSSSLICMRPMWACLASAGMFTLWRCPSNISSADHSRAEPILNILRTCHTTACNSTSLPLATRFQIWVWSKHTVYSAMLQHVWGGWHQYLTYLESMLICWMKQFCTHVIMTHLCKVLTSCHSVLGMSWRGSSASYSEISRTSRNVPMPMTRWLSSRRRQRKWRRRKMKTQKVKLCSWRLCFRLSCTSLTELNRLRFNRLQYNATLLFWSLERKSIKIKISLSFASCSEADRRDGLVSLHSQLGLGLQYNIKQFIFVSQETTC